MMVNNLDWLGELVADRLPARHRQALHDPVHAGQGLGPGPARARPLVHRVQLHAAPGVRLRAPPPDDGRRAADGRRRPVGQHHRRPRADPADEPGGGEGTAAEAAEPAHGLAYKLLLSPSGAKFGKSEGGDAVWLDPDRTSPYAFYQYWLNTDDRDVGTYLRWFTVFAARRIEALEAEAGARSPRGGRPSGRWRSTSRPATHGTDGRGPGDRRVRGAFSCERDRDPEALADALRVGGRVHVRSRAARRRASRSLLAEAGAVRVERRGAPDDRGRRRDDQRRARRGSGAPSRSRSPGSGSTCASASAGARSGAAPAERHRRRRYPA